jgi:hypothetical protein
MIEPKDLGQANNQAARGDHGIHHLEGVILTGAKGGNVALTNLIAILVANFGLTDNTT